MRWQRELGELHMAACAPGENLAVLRARELVQGVLRDAPRYVQIAGAELDDPAAVRRSAHDPIGDAERIHHVERKQRDVRRLEDVATGIKHEIRLLRTFGAAETTAGIGALAEPLQHLAGELHAREHRHVLAQLAEIPDALPPARGHLVAALCHRDARHGEQEAWIDGLVAGLDAFAAEYAGRGPFARGFGPIAGAHQIEHAANDGFGGGGHAGRVGDRTGLDAFSAARACVDHRVDARVQGAFKRHAHGTRNLSAPGRGGQRAGGWQGTAAAAHGLIPRAKSIFPMTHSLNPVARSKEPRRFGVAALIVALLVHPQTAFAAEGTQSGPSEVIFLAEIIVLVLAGRLLGEAMQRIGQPGVVGQLIAGILLGPSVLGLIWPEAQHALFPKTPEQKAMIDAVAQLGILMLLLLTGMETDLALARKVGRAAISISIAGIAAPFLCGFALGQFLPDALLPAPEQRLITSLFLGTALAISSVKIVALIVREMHFMRRNVGQIIVASAIIDDTIGWIIVAIIFGLAQHGTVDAAGVARSVIGTAAFLAVSLTIGRRIVSGLIRWTNDNFVSEVPVISMILVIMGMMALITHLIGVHTVLGAFVSGILVGESPILTRHIDEQLRGLITALFAPVFFGLAGLGTDLSVLRDPSLVWLMLALIVIASVGKFGGAFIGGRLGGLNFRESLALGCGMNARGQTEVIIATIGLSLGMLSHSLFTLIVAMAVVMTTAMPPTLRWALGRLPLGEQERRRLEREEFEAKGFVSNMERLLIAVDDSANGKFASRLAGLIAAAKGMPATVIRVQPADGAAAKQSGQLSGEHAIQAAAQAARVMEDEQESGTPAKVSVITRSGDEPAEETVASEARKGYDLLVIGTEHAARKAEFHEDANRSAAEFEVPLAIVAARGVHL